MMCVSNICDLPSEIIAIIVDDLGKYEYYIGLNITCKSLSNLVSKFSLAREMMNMFFEKFVPTERYDCINPECVRETEGAVLHIWEANSLAYEHTSRQAALNVTTISVNGEKQWIRSHYCCECFKKHILVGDNKNASQYYDYDKRRPGGQHVEVIFHYEPMPSTWYNSVTKRDEELTEFQKSMLCRPVDYNDTSHRR